MNQVTTRSADVMFDDHARQTALDFCDYALTSGILPDAINTPQKAMLIMLKGRELGMGDMEALTTINVIKGKVELSGTAMCAMLTRAGIAIETVRSDDEICELIFHRVVGGIQLSNPVSFSRQDAQRAGLWGGNVWKAYPQLMLYWRAISSGARRHGADVIGGAYLTGEISDAPTDPPIVRDIGEAKQIGEEPAAIEATEQRLYQIKDEIAAAETVADLVRMAVDVDELDPNQIGAARMAWKLKREELEGVGDV